MAELGDMHTNSKMIYREHGQVWISDGDSVLEIGEDESQWYRNNTDACVKEWNTADINGHGDVSMSEYRIHSDKKWDVVVSGQVIEHVRMPWLWLDGISDVLKDGGVIILISPITWEYHEAPIDCWRIYPEGMRALADHCKLSVARCECFSLDESGEDSAHQLGGARTMDLLTILCKV